MTLGRCLVATATLLLLCLLLSATCVSAAQATHTPSTTGASEKLAREALVRELREAVLQRLEDLHKANFAEDRNQRKEGQRPTSTDGTEVSSPSPGEGSASATTPMVALPEPPRALGIHTPCRKFGRGCPDEYITFLRGYLATLPPVPGEDATRVADRRTNENAGNSQKQDTSRGNDPMKASHPVTTKMSFSSLPFTVSDGWSMEEVSRLERLQSYINVLERRLGQAVMSSTRRTAMDGIALPSRLHCLYQQWQIHAMRAFLHVHPMAAAILRVLVWRLLPCSACVALVVWTIWGGPLTKEETAFLLGALTHAASADDKHETAQNESPTSSDAQVSGDSEGSLVAAPAEAPLLAPALPASEHSPSPARASQPLEVAHNDQQHQRRQTVVGFSLLDQYFREETPLIFIKARVVLCLTACLILLWSLYAFWWHARALTAPSTESHAPWPWASRHESGGDRNASGLRLYAQYLAPVAGAPLSIVRAAARGVVSRVVPGWLQSYGILYLGLSFLGSFLVMSAKGLVEAMHDVEEAEMVSARRRAALLQQAHGDD